MKRREFIVLVGGAVVWPLRARTQQPTVPVVGFLRDATADGSEHLVAALREGLREAGFVENQNVVVEYAWTEGHTDRLPAMAADLVRRRVSVIVTSATNATIAAKAATTTVPIVFVVAADPVQFKLVDSLSRPGGNATGISYLSYELGGKRLGLLHELMPEVAHVAVLARPNYLPSENFIRAVQAAAQTLGLKIDVIYASAEPDFDAVFATLMQRRLGALLVATDPFFTGRRLQIVALAARHRVPAIYGAREFVDAGGLMSYGTNVTDVYRQVGVYAGRILKGEKPADLPVVQPTKFDLVINGKTAKMLGLTLPPGLLAIADEMIE